MFPAAPVSCRHWEPLQRCGARRPQEPGSSDSQQAPDAFLDDNCTSWHVSARPGTCVLRVRHVCGTCTPPRCRAQAAGSCRRDYRVITQSYTPSTNSPPPTQRRPSSAQTSRGPKHSPRAPQGPNRRRLSQESCNFSPLGLPISWPEPYSSVVCWPGKNV